MTGTVWLDLSGRWRIEGRMACQSNLSHKLEDKTYLDLLESHERRDFFAHAGELPDTLPFHIELESFRK